MGSLPSPPPDFLRVAIVGAGPAGLGAAIALSKLPNVEVNIYEKATELREVGAGIRIGYNGWKVLRLLGAADGVRGHHKINVFHRYVALFKLHIDGGIARADIGFSNGITGEIVGSTQAESLPPRQQPHRVRRTRLQSALVETVPSGIVHLKKALQHLSDLGDSVRLSFEDGSSVDADLVVGADGIRSVSHQLWNFCQP
jgi:salicylate hydroxylase